MNGGRTVRMIAHKTANSSRAHDTVSQSRSIRNQLYICMKHTSKPLSEISHEIFKLATITLEIQRSLTNT